MHEVCSESLQHTGRKVCYSRDYLLGRIPKDGEGFVVHMIDAEHINCLCIMVTENGCGCRQIYVTRLILFRSIIGFGTDDDFDHYACKYQDMT